MKWIFLALALVCVAPLSIWVRGRPAFVGWLCFAVGVLMFTAEYFHLYMALVSWPLWTGYARGIELSLSDILCIVIIASSYKPGRHYIFLIPMLLYLGAIAVSIVFSGYPLASLFYLWQFTRVILLYVAIATAGAEDIACLSKLLTGLAVGVVFEGALTIYQRFVAGILQTPGTMEHQNQLGLSLHFVMFPVAALLLGNRRGPALPIVLFAGLVANALTTSRGSVALSLAGLALTFAISTIWRRTSRKLVIGAAGLIFLTLVAPLAVISFQARFVGETASLNEDLERISYKEAASNMIADHPLGVGANQFVFVANAEGYYERAGVWPEHTNRAGHVHNIYYLILAETGPLGLITYISMIGICIWRGLWWGVRNLGESGGDILVGCSVSLIIVTIHSWEEWVMISFTLQYFLAASFGMISAIVVRYRQLQEQPRRPRASPLALVSRALQSAGAFR